MLPRNLFCCAVGDDGVTESRATHSHMQCQWLHSKTNPIALSASIKIQKSIERNAHNTCMCACVLCVCIVLGPDQSVCHIDRQSFSSAMVPLNPRTCARAFLAIGFLLSIWDSTFFFLFLSFSIKYVFFSLRRIQRFEDRKKNQNRRQIYTYRVRNCEKRKKERKYPNNSSITK